MDSLTPERKPPACEKPGPRSRCANRSRLGPNVPCGGASFAPDRAAKRSGAVVEPENAVKLIAAAHGGPVANEKLRLGHGREIMEVLRHQIDHAAVAGMVVIRLQAEEHDYVGPEIVAAFQVRTFSRAAVPGPNQPSGCWLLSPLRSTRGPRRSCGGSPVDRHSR